MGRGEGQQGHPEDCSPRGMAEVWGWRRVGRHACVKDKEMEKKVFGGGREGEAERLRENVWVCV